MKKNKSSLRTFFVDVARCSEVKELEMGFDYNSESGGYLNNYVVGENHYYKANNSISQCLGELFYNMVLYNYLGLLKN